MDATREQLFSIYKLFDPYRLYICSSLISLVHNKFAVGCLLCVVLLILNYRLFRYSHNVKPKLIPNRFRRRDKFLYYGHKLLRSFKLYTSLVNRRRTMLKLANKRRILRKQTNKTLMLKGTQLPRFLLEVDSESVRSLQSNNVFSPEIQYLLKNVRVFGHFEKPVILNLCKFVYTKFVPAGSYLFRIGDLDDSIYVVEKGQLQVILTENQKCRYSIKTCTSSDSIFSLLSIADYLAGVKRRFGTVSCKAVVDSTLIALPFKAFTSVFAEFPQSLVRFVQTIMLRFRRITFMTLHDHLGLTAELMHSENEPCERFEHELHKEKLRESFVLHRGTNDDSLKVPTDEYDIKSIASDFDIAFARANLSKASTKVHKVELRERSDSESDHSEYAEFNNESTDLVSDVQKEIESFLQLQTVKLGQMLTIHTVSKNTQLFTEGQPCEKIIYLVKGSIVATCSYLSKTNESGKVNQNKEKPMFTVQPKQFVGILPILTGESSLYTVSAKEKCIIGVIRKEDIYEILQQEPLAVLPLMQSKTRRISNFVRRLDFGMEWTFFEAGKAIYRCA
ncbi:hypothetical protein GJ496_001581 [Pomphorhynchus laevis]|nr:hypothetical protein GJ496_001581 [Pomphorhynchus laevis]